MAWWWRLWLGMGTWKHWRRNFNSPYPHHRHRTPSCLHSIAQFQTNEVNKYERPPPTTTSTTISTATRRGRDSREKHSHSQNEKKTRFLYRWLCRRFSSLVSVRHKNVIQNLIDRKLVVNWSCRYASEQTRCRARERVLCSADLFHFIDNPIRFALTLLLRRSYAL